MLPDLVRGKRSGKDESSKHDKEGIFCEYENDVVFDNMPPLIRTLDKNPSNQGHLLKSQAGLLQHERTFNYGIKRYEPAPSSIYLLSSSPHLTHHGDVSDMNILPNFDKFNHCFEIQNVMMENEQYLIERNETNQCISTNNDGDSAPIDLSLKKASCNSLLHTQSMEMPRIYFLQNKY